MSTVTEWRQHDDLLLRRKVRGDAGLFLVDHAIRVTFLLDGASEYVYVYAGFYTDLASIPAVIPRFIAQKIGPGLEAAVVHDFLYLTQGDGRYNREQCDAIFLGGLLGDGVPSWRAHLMHKAVRLGGGVAWRGHQ